MKKTLLSIIAFLSLVFSQEYNIEDLLEQDGVFIKKFSDEEVNGKVYVMYGDNKVYLGKMKKGKQDGTWIEWYENGLKRSKTIYFKGLVNGKREWWSEYGKMDSSGTYKDGKLNGKWTSWYENGKKKEQETYKNGERIKETTWYPNGQKSSEATYKDRELEGLSTAWYENGQKIFEATFKDGEYDKKWVSWDNNGEKKEELTFDNGKLIEADFALLLDKKIHCTDDSIKVSKIDIKSKKYLIPYDEPYSTQLWLKVIDNLFVAGASHIIFNSNIPNITESYMDIEKNYNNVYRTMNKNELNNFQFDCPVKIKEYFSWHNLFVFPVYGLSSIIDTEDVTLHDPIEDLDWMSQFLPGEVPEWITAIEDPQERKDMMDTMGIGEEFDITQSPFYNNVILIGF